MYFINLIKELEMEFNLGIKDPSTEAICLKINEEYHLSFYSKDNGQSVLIESDIYELESSLGKDFYQHMLSANFEGVLPWETYFGINPETNHALLMKKVLLEHIDYDEFLIQLNQFITLYEELQQQLYHWKIESFFHNKPTFEQKSANQNKLFI